MTARGSHVDFPCSCYLLLLLFTQDMLPRARALVLEQALHLFRMLGMAACAVVSSCGNQEEQLTEAHKMLTECNRWDFLHSCQLNLL